MVKRYKVVHAVLSGSRTWSSCLEGSNGGDGGVYDRIYPSFCDKMRRGFELLRNWDPLDHFGYCC